MKKNAIGLFIKKNSAYPISTQWVSARIPQLNALCNKKTIIKYFQIVYISYMIVIFYCLLFSEIGKVCK